MQNSVPLAAAAGKGRRRRGTGSLPRASPAPTTSRLHGASYLAAAVASTESVRLLFLPLGGCRYA